ncbi:thioesterase family protein [Selenomonas ruminantium]|uniref:Predicted thioesterase n=1 Tax=Selenomonas ruminantium TaxID=971 RepID=A0A1H4ADA1_SELRU|nr:thioesterase family protein [Selenomonas ruminantium]SEA33738.1 Predicted thioesterase [Selenomonas ruminantium]
MELTAVQVGLKNTVSEEVTEARTARVMGSGSLPVYATPAMTCLMEKAATEAVEALVPEGWTTVGISLHVAHTAATPVGLTVRAEAEVTAVEGRKIIFTVRAYDDQGEIGVGSHERFAVAKEKFLAKAAAKVQH